MAGVISTGNHPKALWPGVAAWFGNKYDEHPVEYTQIFDVKSSSKAWEEDVMTTGFGMAPVKPEGSNTVYDSHNQQYVARYTNVAYALGYVCTKEELDDNLYEAVSMQRSESLAFSIRQTEETVGANVLNNVTTAGFTGGDGVVLGSASHTSPAGNWSNILSTAADISEASLEDLCIDIMNATGPRGLKISLLPRRLIVPTALAFEVERILKSQLQNDTANNAINALRSRGVVPEVAINHYLTDADAWHIKTNAPRGLCWYDRQSVQFTKDSEFDSENAKAKGYRRFAAGWSDPRGYYGSTGA